MKRPERLFRQLNVAPRQTEVDKLKQQFELLNEFVRTRHGWLTSVPGEVEVEMQCLPGSTLPAELRGLGYEVTETGDAERILPGFVAGGDGALQSLTTGSTRPVALTVTHAGICKVQRWAFSLT